MYNVSNSHHSLSSKDLVRRLPWSIYWICFGNSIYDTLCSISMESVNNARAIYIHPWVPDHLVRFSRNFKADTLSHPSCLPEQPITIQVFLITISIGEITGNMVYGIFSVLLCFLWLDTRIRLSKWNHHRTCTFCPETCKYY